MKSLFILSAAALLSLPLALNAQSLKTKDGKDIPLTKQQWKDSAEQSKKERKEKSDARKKEIEDKITDRKKAVENKVEANKEAAKAKREANKQKQTDKANEKLNKIGLKLS